MDKPIRILLQTTIPPVENDWSIDRFSLLRDYLSSIRSEQDDRRVEVIARNREENADGDDVVLSQLDRQDIDELWLFAVDVGNGLSARDCEGIARFRQRGGGFLAVRDHHDVGCSLRALADVGAAHHFYSYVDEAARAIDAPGTSASYWPHYLSGDNGDYQRVVAAEPVHELMKNPDVPSGVIEFFPAHPHEGDLGTPPSGRNARVIATSTNQRTGRPFNLAVAFERSRDAEGRLLGRAVAESSFHHFVDYNWDIERGCPDFVEEAPAGGIRREPHKLEHVKRYVRNLAYWLAPERQ